MQQCTLLAKPVARLQLHAATHSSCCCHPSWGRLPFALGIVRSSSRQATRETAAGVEKSAFRMLSTVSEPVSTGPWPVSAVY